MLDRRRFLQAGAAAGLAALTPLGVAETGRFAYVSFMQSWLQVYGMRRQGWTLQHMIRSAGAAGVTVSPGGRFVYVGNAVDQFENRPTGSVETFAVDGPGHVRSIGRQGLALFVGGPERLAVSPDGRWLAVGLARGAYNLLPVGEDGLPGRVVASVRKLGGKPAAGALVFAEGGSLLVSGDGEDRTVLSVGRDGALAFTNHVPVPHWCGRGKRTERRCGVSWRFPTGSPEGRS